MEKIHISYNGKQVTAYRLRIASHIGMDVERAWELLKTSALLKFITKGKVTFKPIGGKFPELWTQGSTVKTKMLLYGWLPFGGVHTLYFERIDEQQKVLATQESDAVCKVWNHSIFIEKAENNSIRYTDEIIIYAGIFSKIVALWAKQFYIYRQKRWKKIK
ncbi:hypothetical protein [Tannerella sp.]|uniref:hypothetical protein n=1 Tax=Tannerella sp. TaxID=2382127 RepID=UPI0026DD9B23|nr:hypothetical protein [Tannerella sp.]MDO4702463.1 hypothetical protein [Tannerella sp.]